MHPTRHTLPLATRKKSIALLGGLLADAVDLYSQIKQAHWNVRGPSFIALHELFDKIAEETEDHVDSLAERIAQLGGQPRGTARVAAADSRLKEYPLDISEGPDHVAAVADALAAVGTSARNAIDEADAFGDAATSDLCTEITRGVDQHLWLVEAHLQAKK